MLLLLQACCWLLQQLVAQLWLRQRRRSFCTPRWPLACAGEGGSLVVCEASGRTIDTKNESPNIVTCQN